MACHPRLVGVTVLLLSLTALASAVTPWDIPFAKDAKAIIAAAQAVPAPSDVPVQVLLEEHRHVIDARGLSTITKRYVYRALNAEALQLLTAVQQPYQPWYEDRPKLRARVISISGEVHTLDPSHIADSPTRQINPAMLSDQRILLAPLPAVAVGSVVEAEITVSEKRPGLLSGDVRRIDTARPMPVERFYIRIEADRAMPLRIAGKGIPEGSLRREESRKGTVVECELFSLKPDEDPELFTPFDVSPYPYLTYSTASAWKAVAGGYYQIVEKALAGGVPPAWLEGIDRGADPLSIVKAVSDRLQKDVRYTSVAFGKAAIEPRTPEEVLSGKYGDCKDKGALLVGALRSLGVPAYLALLSAGNAPDVDEDLPGIGLFNHAIVYVDTDPPVWVDATAPHFPVGSVPSHDQGRLALIVRPETTGLVTIPEAKAGDNWLRHVIEIRMADYGPATVEETMEAGGASEAALRARYGGSDEQLRKAAEWYVKTYFSGEVETLQAEPGNGEGASSFRVTLSTANTQQAVTSLDDATLTIYPGRVFEGLEPLRRKRLVDGKRKRNADYLLPQAHRVEHRYRIHLPKQFKPIELPDPVEVSLGSGSYVKTYTLREDGVLEVIARLDTGARRMTPDEYFSFQDGIEKYGSRSPESLKFVPEANELLTLGKTTEALSLARAHIDREPGSAIAYIRRARMLLGLGMVIPARHDARKATELSPSLSVAWQMLGLALQTSAFGRPFSGDWDRDKAGQAFRRALERAPTDNAARASLAVLLEHNERGERYAAGVSLEESIALYREILKEDSHHPVNENLARILVHAQQFEAAIEQSQKCRPETKTVIALQVAALTKGTGAVLTHPSLSSVDGGSRAVQYVRVAAELMKFQRYQDAGTLIAAASRLMSSRELQVDAEKTGKVKPHREAVAQPSDPRYPVQQLVVHSLLGVLSEETIRPLLSARMRWDGDAESIRYKAERRSPGGFLGMLESSRAVLADFAVSGMDAAKGDDLRGYIVPSSLPGYPTYYVVLEEGSYRILGLSGNMFGVGAHILGLLEKNDIVAARWWLDELIPALKPLDEEGNLPSMRVLWSGVGEAQRGPSAIRHTAASLMGGHKGSLEGINLLKAGRAKASNSYERSVLDLAIAESLESMGLWEELLPLAKKLAETSSHAGRGLDFAQRAAIETENWAELERIAARRLLDDSQDAKAMAAIAMARARMNDTPTALEWCGKLSEKQGWETDSVLLESWISLYGGVAASELLSRFENSSSLQDLGARDAGVQFTLAMLQASVGKVGEAIHSATGAAQLERLAIPSSRAWAVYSMLCEHLGSPEAAAEALGYARTASRQGRFADWALAVAAKGTVKKAGNGTGVE